MALRSKSAGLVRQANVLSDCPTVRLFDYSTVANCPVHSSFTTNLNALVIWQPTHSSARWACPQGPQRVSGWMSKPGLLRKYGVHGRPDWLICLWNASISFARGSLISRSKAHTRYIYQVYMTVRSRNPNQHPRTLHVLQVIDDITLLVSREDRIMQESVTIAKRDGQTLLRTDFKVTCVRGYFSFYAPRVHPLLALFFAKQRNAAIGLCNHVYFPSQGDMSQFRS